MTLKKYGFDCIYANEFIYSIFKKGTRENSFENFYADILNYLRTVEDNTGDVVSLIIIRAINKISSFPGKSVLLYGAAEEMDVLVQSLPDVGSIRGFFYSDRKTPAEVIEYIQSSSNSSDTKCLVLVDSKRDKSLCEAFFDQSKASRFELFSIYSEIF